MKGQLGPYRFRTRTQKKTLAPMWQEEFKIPIHTWESPSVLLLEVCDEDHFLNDAVGSAPITNTNNLCSTSLKRLIDSSNSLI